MECALIDASAEFGTIAGAVRDVTTDGIVCGKDRDRIVGEIDDALRSLVRMRAIVAEADTS